MILTSLQASSFCFIQTAIISPKGTQLHFWGTRSLKYFVLFVYFLSGFTLRSGCWEADGISLCQLGLTIEMGRCERQVIRGGSPHQILVWSPNWIIRHISKINIWESFISRHVIIPFQVNFQFHRPHKKLKISHNLVLKERSSSSIISSTDRACSRH